jgi:hypothetical protein
MIKSLLFVAILLSGVRAAGQEIVFLGVREKYCIAGCTITYSDAERGKLASVKPMQYRVVQVSPGKYSIARCPVPHVCPLLADMGCFWIQ